MILHGDCRQQLATLPDASVDAIVTDPPYELGFMGKKWDASGIAYDPDVWGQCLRVLKPGGHLLAFGGTRTYHRMTCAIEDAGFEIRDSLHWLYGSGFPKSLDVSKAIDKGMGHWRGKAGSVIGQSHSMENPHYETTEKGDPITPAAAAAAGWGTALKPAHEPIVLARKPLVGTVAANVMEYGTGALNIEGCRVGFANAEDERESKTKNQHADFNSSTSVSVAHGDFSMVPPKNYNPPGRWPSNVILTHAPECADKCAPDCPITILDTQSGERPGGSFPTQRGAGVATGFGPGQPTEGGRRDMGDAGGASRYFATTTWDPELDVPFLYVAKPSRAERNAGLDANFHPTVKPVALIRYLIRLITPPDGTVLDPFLGSGTTAVAAILEGRQWIGCELTDDYLLIIEARVAHARTIPIQQDLFG